MPAKIGNELRIAVIGCGAISEFGHLPALQMVPDASVTLLVDIDVARRERLAREFGVARTAGDFNGHEDLFDAAIVAVPNALHAPVSAQLLGRGKDVLVEKPIAIDAADCDNLIRLADQNHVVLSVSLPRRFLWSNRFARSLISGGVLGPTVTFSFKEGYVYNWPVASDFPFRREVSGGGVLIDTGPHTLDCLLQWLGSVAEIKYYDDANGGVEANCLIELHMHSGARGTVELSRTRSLRNTAIIRGEHGTLEVGLGSNMLKLTLQDRSHFLCGSVESSDKPEKEQSYVDLITLLIRDFVQAAKNGHETATDGRSVGSAMRLINTCYRSRQPLHLPAKLSFYE